VKTWRARASSTFIENSGISCRTTHLTMFGRFIGLDTGKSNLLVLRRFRGPPILRGCSTLLKWAKRSPVICNKLILDHIASEMYF
jgi:hypothetical protein